MRIPRRLNQPGGEHPVLYPSRNGEKGFRK